MTIQLNNKIKKKDLPKCDMHNLGLPELGNLFFHEAERILFANVSAIFGVCLPHFESNISCAAF
jgi:hypothetical protein